MRQSDKTFYSLCEEIDELRKEVDFWKEEYESEKKLYNKLLNENVISAGQYLANALQFALSVSDDEHGNLVIRKEARKELANNWA